MHGPGKPAKRIIRMCGSDRLNRAMPSVAAPLMLPWSGGGGNVILDVHFRRREGFATTCHRSS